MIAGDELETIIRITLGPAAVDRLRAPQGLQLWGTIGLDVFLDREGSVWAEEEGAPRRRVVGVEVLTHLLLASETSPGLGALLPARPEEALECARCAGVGTHLLSATRTNEPVYLAMSKPLRFYCPDCGGVGYLVAAPAR